MKKVGLLGVSVGCKEVDKSVRCFCVLVKAIILRPEGVVEVEISQEDSAFVK